MESPGASGGTRSANDGKATHIFTELRSHGDLLLPVRGSKRLKYTCITCSRQYIALGSSHGGLYIFQRDSLKYLQQIGNKEGLTKALFSPDENVVGMATSGGAIIVWKLNVTSRQKAERLVATQAHRHHQITSLCWDGAGLRLFSADERGRITVTNTDSSKPSGIFKFQSELVVDVDSSVVQMDFAEERLLISTMTRCYLCDPKKQLSFPIGTKLRDGAYGACFMKKTGSEKPSIFCARPGSRMWEANTLCQVLSTHQFKQLLSTPPLPVMGKGREVTFPAEDTEHPPQSLAFPVLHPLGNHFLVTWNDRGVYVFDPVNVNVVFWTSNISGLVDVSVSKSSLYCLHQDSHIRKYTLQAIARCAASLYQQSLLIQCSRLVIRFQTLFQRSRARHHMPSRVLHELAKRVAAEDSLLACDVEELAVSVENSLLDVVSAASSRRSSFDSYDGMRMQSGIYVVRKRLDSECSDELPLGYDAHMDQMQGNIEWTEKSRQETIQETSPIKVDRDSKEATPTEDIKLEVGVSLHVAVPKDENSIEEIVKEENGSKDDEREDGILDEQNLHMEDNKLLVVDVEENSPAGADLADQQQSTSEGLEERVNDLDEQAAESCGVDGEEIIVGRDETDTPEGIRDATDYVRNAQRLPGRSPFDGSEPALGIEESDLLSVEPDSILSLRNSISCGNNEENIHPVEDVLALEEKALQPKDAVTDEFGSFKGGQSLAEENLRSDSPEQDLDKVEEVIQDTGTTANIAKSAEVPVVDGSPDEDRSTGQEILQDEFMVEGMGFDPPVKKLVIKDIGSADAVHGTASEECLQVGMTESNQRKTLSNTLENNRSVETSVTNTSGIQLDISGVKSDREAILQDMQVLKVGGSKTDVKEGAKNLENQRIATGADVDKEIETPKLLSGENLTNLSDSSLAVNKEKEASDETLRDESPIQDQDANHQTTREESVSPQLDDILIEEENMEVATGSVSLTTDNDESPSGFGLDVSGFGLDVSGFGMSPSEKSFHHPSQAEDVSSYDQSISVYPSAIIDGLLPGQGEDITGRAKGSHQPASGIDSHPSSASNNAEEDGIKEEERKMMLTTSKGVDDMSDATLKDRRKDGDMWMQDESKELASHDSSTNAAIDQHNTNLFASGYYSSQVVPVDEEACSSLSKSSPVSNISTMDDSINSFSSLDKSKESSIESNSCISDDSKSNQSLLSNQNILSSSTSSENLEIVQEDDLGKSKESSIESISSISDNAKSDQSLLSNQNILSASNSSENLEIVREDDLHVGKSKESSIESISSISDDAKSNQSLLSNQNILSASTSSENLEIVREDDLEVAEEDAQFPDAETELIQAVTGGQYVQREMERKRERSLSREKISQESSKGSAPAASVKRKKTKSRVIDITATVSSKPSPLPAMTAGSVLYRPTSLPDLSHQSSSQPRPLQRTPSSTTPSPAMSPKKEARRPFPVSSALPSSNLIIAATSGLPHASGLVETQQIILGSAAQINLKSVKDSLTSKLSKTKTFLQSMGDSNPLSPKEGEQRSPPMQPRPSPSSSPISGSPTHRKGASPSVAHMGISYQNSTTRLHISPVTSPLHRPHPSPVTSPLHRPHPPGERDFPHVEVEEETEEEQIDSRLSQDLIEATKSVVPALRDPQTHYNTKSLRNVLQPWVSKLKQTYISCQAEGIVPWSSGHHLPGTVRDDVGRLATLCISLDIYANEEGDGCDEVMKQERGSEFELEGNDVSDISKIDECRAAFIKRHFIILDRRRVMEVLQHKQGCHHSAMNVLLQCEEDAARNTNISEALDNGDMQGAFDRLFRANLSSSNLPLSLSFLQRLCVLDSGRALDIMISDYPTIGPWHAYHILQHQTNSKSLVLDYVESFLATHPFSQRKKFIQQSMAMKPLVVSLAEAAVTSDPPSSSDIFCDCGELPKLGSHLIKWSHDAILDLLLTWASVPVDVILPLFWKAGYWHGAVVLMARERYHKMEALKLCIQLGDVALISNDFIPSSDEEWRTVLEWMKKCQPSTGGKCNSSERKCLHCGESLSPCIVKRPSTSEVMSEVIVKVEKQDAVGVEERLSPSSQPECDWSIMEPSEAKDKSENLTENDAHSTAIDKSDGFEGDRENGEPGNSQSGNSLETSLSQKNVTSQSEEGIGEISAPEQNRLENTSSLPSSLNDSDWLPTVTWQRIALLLVSRIGALKGINLLREVGVPEGLLSREFHQMCIYVSIWEKKQSLLSHAMLEGTGTYLWSKRQPLLGPLLQHTITKEYQGVKQGRTDTGSEGERVLKAQNLLSQDQLFIEDPGTHWGRTTNLSRICSVCNQAVTWSSSLQSAGCMIFPCGHVFHTYCLPEKACIICFYGNKERKL